MTSKMLMWQMRLFRKNKTSSIISFGSMKKRERYFCLMEGPDTKSYEATHLEAHGNVVRKTEDVELGFYELFMGKNVPIDTGNEYEGLLVLKDSKWIVLRVLYPLGFYIKWMAG